MPINMTLMRDMDPSSGLPENLREGRLFWRQLVAHADPTAVAGAVASLAEPGRTLVRQHLEEDHPIRAIALKRRCSERIIRKRLGHAF